MSKISQFKKSKRFPNLYSIWAVWAIGKIENKFITYSELLYIFDGKGVFPTRKLAREYRKKHLKKITKYKEKLKKKIEENNDLYNSEW
jgi:hypothetical protein